MDLRSKWLLVACCLLASCATANKPTTEKYKARLQNLVGTNINDLVARRGPPTSTFKMTNGKTIYMKEVRSNPTSTAVYNDFSGQLQTTTNQWWCKTSLVVNQQDIIESYSFEGNWCISD